MGLHLVLQHSTSVVRMSQKQLGVQLYVTVVLVLCHQTQ